MFAGDLDAKRFRLEPMAAAGFAGDVGEILGKLLARPFALGLAIAAVYVGDHSFERLLGVVGAYAVFIGEDDLVQGAIAPLRSVSSLSGITNSSSICCSIPRPPQAGQAP